MISVQKRVNPLLSHSYIHSVSMPLITIYHVLDTVVDHVTRHPRGKQNCQFLPCLPLGHEEHRNWAHAAWVSQPLSRCLAQSRCSKNVPWQFRLVWIRCRMRAAASSPCLPGEPQGEWTVNFPGVGATAWLVTLVWPREEVWFLCLSTRDQCLGNTCRRASSNIHIRYLDP